VADDKVVVDASVVLHWLRPEPDHSPARKLRAQYASEEILLVAPDHLPLEVGSSLARQHRRKLITADTARAMFRLFRKLQPVLCTTDSPEPVLELSLAHQISFWDAGYLHLSLVERCTLVTADARLFRSVGRAYPNIRLIETPT
jgi:predicted nucleic acid-binding protein